MCFFISLFKNSTSILRFLFTFRIQPLSYCQGRYFTIHTHTHIRYTYMYTHSYFIHKSIIHEWVSYITHSSMQCLRAYIFRVENRVPLVTGSMNETYYSDASSRRCARVCDNLTYTFVQGGLCGVFW